jgi:hypothetical protein
MATKQPRAFLEPILALIPALLLSACATDVRWEKAGIDEATLAGDLSGCRKQTQAMYGPAGAVMPSSPIDPRFGPTGPSPAQGLMQQDQAVGQCMRGKGYKLVTVEKK